MMSDTRESVMRDWSGIAVHVDDVVIFVNVLQRRIIRDFKYIDPENKKLYSARNCEGMHFGFSWYVTWEALVVEIDGVAHIPAPLKEGLTMIPISLIWDMYVQESSGAQGSYFAIKGISDDPEKFFRNFFRRGVMNRN